MYLEYAVALATVMVKKKDMQCT